MKRNYKTTLATVNWYKDNRLETTIIKTGTKTTGFKGQLSKLVQRLQTLKDSYQNWYKDYRL